MFSLKFKTDNAAFDDKTEEVARILLEIARQLTEGYTSGRATDYNGNRVGEWRLT